MPKSSIEKVTLEWGIYKAEFFILEIRGIELTKRAGDNDVCSSPFEQGSASTIEISLETNSKLKAILARQLTPNNNEEREIFIDEAIRSLKEIKFLLRACF